MSKFTKSGRDMFSGTNSHKILIDQVLNKLFRNGIKNKEYTESPGIPEFITAYLHDDYEVIWVAWAMIRTGKQLKDLTIDDIEYRELSSLEEFQIFDELSFEIETITKLQNFPVSRGLISDTIYDMYNLPTFNGVNFIKILNEKITKGPLPVRILDIGFGSGRFLLDLKEHFGNNVELVGIGALKYSETVKDEKTGAPLIESIKGAQIDLQEIGLIDFNKIKALGSFDLIVSSHAYIYSKYPKWETLVNLCELLKPEGLALLDGFSLEGSKQEVAEVINIARNNGINIENPTTRSVSIQKVDSESTLTSLEISTDMKSFDSASNRFKHINIT